MFICYSLGLYIPPIILYLLYFNVLVYYYFYFLFFYCDVYVCICVSNLNYPKQIVILAACPFNFLVISGSQTPYIYFNLFE